MTRPRMTEQQLLANVLDLCELLGLRTAHFRPAQTAHGWRTPVAGDGQGWPDLVIVGTGGILVRELKSERGRVEAHQRVWLDALAGAGVDAAVWRPAHWLAGTVNAELKALRGLGGECR